MTGQLGDGTKDPRNAPVHVLGGQDGVVDVAAADSHTCALSAGGGVQCWGWNGEGELGDGTGVSGVTPVDVLGLQTGVTDVESGELHSCAVKEDRHVVCWGANWAGQLGDGTTEDRLAPVAVEDIQDAVTLAGGETDLSCVLRQSGAVYCWGSNFNGQLGAGLPDSYKTAPVAVVGLTNGVRSISAGGNHACAVKENGHVVCWGRNSNGQLGDGTFNLSNTPVEVDGITNAESVAAGGGHTCIVTTGGAAKCWGLNTQGQLGDGSTDQSSEPVQVSGLSSGVAQLTAGAAHTCALLDDGTVKCWGWNSSGELGNGTNDQSLHPVDVELLPPPAGPTPTATAAAGLKQGDVDCSGSVTSVDSLKQLRYVAQLSVQQNEPCPDIGTDVASFFGDVDCSGGVTSVDALKVLRYVALLSVSQTEPCADIGEGM
jgi:alpha-tubulin suppressor-like RCC1 family protein